jgi:D-sedoheptulose 7-phosphate isomerase
MNPSILAKARQSADTQLAFFEEHADQIDACVLKLAERFQRGGRLWVMGNGGSACDAEHVALEFTHPVVEKRPALPAASLTHAAALTAIGNDSDFAQVFAEQLEILARPEDVALGISTSGQSANVARGFKRARAKGLLTVGFAGRDGGQFPDLCDFCFTVRSWSIHRIQEAHVILLHVLWDHLHVSLGEDDVL